MIKMKKPNNLGMRLSLILMLFALSITFHSCKEIESETQYEVQNEVVIESEEPEYFLLRSDV